MQRDTSLAKSKVEAPGPELIVVLVLNYYFNPPPPFAYPVNAKIPHYEVFHLYLLAPSTPKDEVKR